MRPYRGNDDFTYSSEAEVAFEDDGNTTYTKVYLPDAVTASLPLREQPPLRADALKRVRNASAGSSRI